jgi:hypothetical protein
VRSQLRYRALHGGPACPGVPRAAFGRRRGPTGTSVVGPAGGLRCIWAPSELDGSLSPHGSNRADPPGPATAIAVDTGPTSVGAPPHFGMLGRDRTSGMNHRLLSLELQGSAAHQRLHRWNRVASLRVPHGTRFRAPQDLPDHPLLRGLGRNHSCFSYTLSLRRRGRAHAPQKKCVCVCEQTAPSKIIFASQSFGRNCSPAPDLVL